jgi:FkbM family methyltransferase
MSSVSTKQISCFELVQTQVGFDLLADPRDFLSILLNRDGFYELPETDIVSRIVRVGDTCIDAGCHLGYYSCLMARLVRQKGIVYCFDANPDACESARRNLALNGLYSAQVFQAALADQAGTRPFYLSTENQTGLSSLGSIPSYKEVISVPCVRLDAFMTEKNIDKIRLLKLDVEGAEELVLRGLGSRLADHVIDFILVECFDERLQQLGTSATAVADILQTAGYSAWEFGTERHAAWSRTATVRSRGDACYLFASPAVAEQTPTFPLVAMLGQSQESSQRLREQVRQLQEQLREVEEQKHRLQEQRDLLANDTSRLTQTLQEANDDNDWLLRQLKETESALIEQTEVERIVRERQELLDVWNSVEHSAGWRMLNRWRGMRDILFGETTWLRKIYDRALRPLRG